MNRHRSCESPTVHKGQARAAVGSGLVYVASLNTDPLSTTIPDLGHMFQEVEGVWQVCPALGTCDWQGKAACPYILLGAL